MEKVYIASYSIKDKEISIRKLVESHENLSFTDFLNDNDLFIEQTYGIKYPVIIFATSINNN